MIEGELELVGGVRRWGDDGEKILKWVFVWENRAELVKTSG